MKGNSLELLARTSSSLEKVARNSFDRLSARRLFKLAANECTRLSMPYIELAKEKEYMDTRALGIRVPPSIEVALGLDQ